MRIRWVVNSDGLSCREWRGKKELEWGTMNWGKKGQRAEVQSVLGPDDGTK